MFGQLLQTAATAGEELNTALTNSITPNSIISQFTSILPWIAGMVGISFVVYEGRKLIRGASRAKVKA